MLTIIKQRAERHGSIKTYDVVQTINGRRVEITMLAKSFRELTANLLANQRQPMRVAA